VGKLHVLQVTDGLFMREVYEVAEQYPDVTLREVDVDAVAAELYTKPSAFDVILTTNMFGDILSNLVNALAGGLGTASSLNVGKRTQPLMPDTAQRLTSPARVSRTLSGPFCRPPRC
jgi:isocitrate/isopropylmalate dehydrogenase